MRGALIKHDPDRPLPCRQCGAPPTLIANQVSYGGLYPPFYLYETHVLRNCRACGGWWPEALTKKGVKP